MNVPARREQSDPAPVQVDDLMKPLISLDQALRVSDVLARSELIPNSLRGKPASVFHVIMTGQALKLHWTEAVRVIYSPGPGQIGLRAQFLLHQVRQAGHRYTIEPLENACKVTIIRGDTEEKFTSTFTIEDAIHGGLVQRKPNGDLVALSQSGKPLPWMQWDKKLLRWRAVTDVVSFAVPEAGLGFEVDGGGGPEPQPPVELHPETPAPPEPGDGKAAPGDGQAAQAEQLREMDERFTITSEGAEAMATVMETRVIPQVGGISAGGGESAGHPTEPAQDVGTTGTGSPSAPDVEPEAGTPVDEPGDRPVDATGKAPTKVLSEWLTWFGYDPKLYRAEVLRTCSVYTRRNITGVRDLKQSEVLELCNELVALWRLSTTSELAPVSMLADQMTAWAQAWETEDPDGYALYTGPQ